VSAALERARTLIRELHRSGQFATGSSGALADLLYTRWYHDVSEATRAYPDLAGYRLAYAAGAGFERGWRVAALRPDAGPGAILAERPGEQRLALATEYVPAEAGRLHVEPGDDILVQARVDEVNNGFWHLWSRAWRKSPPPGLIRVYFQVASGCEIAFVNHVAAHAPPEVAWSMKILAGRHAVGRRDGAVMYVDRDEGTRAHWLAHLIAGVGPLIADGAPPFTSRLRAGVAWADDPGEGVSFGEHRCRLLAAAACSQPSALANARAWRLAAARAFARAGLELDKPHLHVRRRRRRAHAV
jgi:hypothetical protein